MTSHARVLRPATQLLRQGVITLAALTAPLFAVFYWLTIPHNLWPIVLAAQVFVTALGALIGLGYASATIWVSSDGVRERGFFGATRSYPIAEIGGILLLETYRGSALDSEPQLFVCGNDGRRLLRMRGTFWQRADMDALIENLDLPVHVVDGTFTMAELRHTRPELLYWFERFPWMRTDSARA
ncbi:MAG: hypothetical protein ABI310_02440 [Microbacteriaceae bacterium]